MKLEKPYEDVESIQKKTGSEEEAREDADQDCEDLEIATRF